MSTGSERLCIALVIAGREPAHQAAFERRAGELRADGSFDVRRLHPDEAASPAGAGSHVFVVCAGGVEVCPVLVAHHGEVPIILEADDADPSLLLAALRAGVAEVVTPGNPVVPVVTRVLRHTRFNTRKPPARIPAATAVPEFERLADNLPDIIARFDRDMKHLYVNHAVEKVTGLTRSQMVGKSNRDLGMPDDLCDIWDNQVHAVFDSNQPCRSEFEYTGPIGRNFYEAHMVPEFDPDGQCRSVLCLTRDVTERHQIAQQLRIAAAHAEAANQAKDQFLAVLSHELRTPLTPILLLSQLMESQTHHAPEVRDFARIIRRNVELEARLIDDLLDLTRVAHNKIELLPAHVEVHEKMRHVIQMLETDVQAKSLTLDFRTDAAVNTVWADPARLQQIFSNLLRNAVKFTPDGGSIVVTTTNPSPQLLRIEIADTGVGIDPDVLPKLFSAFEQGGAAVTRQFGGLGLGLAISKALTEMHDGTLAARSPGRDKGATFTLELPVHIQAQPTPSPTPARPPAPKYVVSAPADLPHKPRILLVEDHEDSGKLMARILRHDGYDVDMVTTVADAVRVGLQQPFDLIISDIGLPDGSGLDVMEQLRQRHPNLRGIALSGFGTEADIAKSHDAGFNAHLTKPVDLNRLSAVIRQTLDAPAK